MTGDPEGPSNGLRERIEALAGMSRLLPALDGLPPAFLVGGAVRDLLRGASTVDLDVAFESDAHAAARLLAERLRGAAVMHERFGTATVTAPDLRVDLATARRESYAAPGALPQVEPASLVEDLARRDFTINAMAAGLSGADIGRLYDPHAGREDLHRGAVRVLHERSFLDDPTRLLRALRYEARLGGALTASSEALAREAIAAGAPATVSAPRVRHELLRLLGEPTVAGALARMSELGLDRALHPALAVDARRAADAADAAPATGAEPALAALSALVSVAPDELGAWLERLGLARTARERVARAARRAQRLAAELTADLSPSGLHALLAGEPPEALALALALGAPRESIFRYLERMRDVHLEIDGDDLTAAGVAPSAALGRALAETLRRKLDGSVCGRDEELRLALELVRGEDG